jgi:hypothetical protein
MSEQLTQQTVVSRSDGPVSADMLGEVALMSITNGKYCSLRAFFAETSVATSDGSPYHTSLRGEKRGCQVFGPKVS